MPYVMVGRRAKEVAAAAAKYHLEFLETEAFGLTARPLSLFAQSDGRVAENLLVGRVRGQEVYGFDFPYLTGPRPDIELFPAGFPHIRYENGNQYGCVLVPTDAHVPMVHISRRGRRGHLASGVETPARVENRAFSKIFHVWSENPAFLHEILTPTLVTMLVETEGRFTFEMFGDAILCLDRTIRAEEFPAVMGLAVAFKEKLPADLSERFPRIDAPGAPPSSPSALARPIPGLEGDRAQADLQDPFPIAPAANPDVVDNVERF